MSVMFPGLSPEAVRKRHLRYAQALADDGVEFELLAGPHRPAVEALLNASLAEAAQAAGVDSFVPALGAFAPAADSTGGDVPIDTAHDVSGAGDAEDAAGQALPEDAQPADRPDGLTLLPQDSGIVVHRAGTVLAAAVVSALQFDGDETRTAVFLRGLGTHMPYRGRGIATVALGLIPQVLSSAGLPTKSQVITRIPTVRASFFHRAGYMVEGAEAQVPEPIAELAQGLLPDFGAESRWAHQSLV